MISLGLGYSHGYRGLKKRESLCPYMWELKDVQTSFIVSQSSAFDISFESTAMKDAAFTSVGCINYPETSGR